MKSFYIVLLWYFDQSDKKPQFIPAFKIMPQPLVPVGNVCSL